MAKMSGKAGETKRPEGRAASPQEKAPTYQEVLDESLDETFPASDPIASSAAMNTNGEISTGKDDKDWVLDPGGATAEPASKQDDAAGVKPARKTAPRKPAVARSKGPIVFPTADNPHPAPDSAGDASAQHIDETAESRTQRVREAAYRRFQERGGNHGGDLEDWVAAEAEIDGRSRP